MSDSVITQRFRVHVLRLDAVGCPTHLVYTCIPDAPNSSHLAYDTGAGFTIHVVSIEAYVMVFTRASDMSAATDYFVGYMSVGEFRRVPIRDGFEVSVVRVR